MKKLNRTFSNYIGLKSHYSNLVVINMAKKIMIEFRRDYWFDCVIGSLWQETATCHTHHIKSLGIFFHWFFFLAASNASILFPFSTTINKVQNNAKYFYCHQRYIITREYFEKPIIPVPPFILFCYLWMFTRYLWHQWRLSCTNHDQHEEDNYHLIKIFSKLAW